MGGRIQEVSGNAADNTELAEFLAAFVQEGNLAHPRTGDTDAKVWQQRFRWWWDENPFCEEDSPRGSILRDDSNAIVGFNGMIPFQYAIDGEVVPALAGTSFFVREAHRSSVMGLLAKQRKLARKFHMIDGSPSEEMQRLLDRLDYQHSGERFQYFFPLRRMGGELTRSVLRCFGLCFELPELADEGSTYLASSVDEIESIPELKDGKLRRRVTPESLEWLSNVGTEARVFFGLCDSYGELIAYAIGIYKQRWGLSACMLMDYIDFRPEEQGFAQLLRQAMEEPEKCGIRPDTELLTWSILGEEEKPPARGLRRSTTLFYQLPPGRETCSKACVPFEGDLVLL